MNRLQSWIKFLPKIPKELVIQVPGEVFFAQSLELPQELSAVELQETAALALEEASPFPMDQLAWGLYRPQGTTFAFIFATAKERLKALNLENLEQAAFVLPGFFGALLIPTTRRLTRAVLSGHTLTLLTYAEDNPTARMATSFPLSIEGDLLEEAFAQLEKIKQAPMSQNYPLEEGLWRTEEPATQPDGTLHFKLTHFRSSTDTALTHASFPQPTLTTLWAADIRDKNFKIGAQKIQKIGQRLWVGMLAAIVAIGILVLSEFTWAVQNWRLGRMERTIEAREVHVQQIEEDQLLVEKMEHFSEFELRPFEMLDVLTSNKPRTMYFTQINAQELKKMEVRGVGGSVEEVNAYTNIISQQPTIESVELADIQSRQGKVSFTLNVNFRQEAWVKPAAEPEVEQEIPAESAESSPNAEPTNLEQNIPVDNTNQTVPAEPTATPSSGETNTPAENPSESAAASTQGTQP